MKQVLVMLVTSVLVSTGMVSCSKCGHCDYSGTTPDGSKLCSKDGKTAYDNYKAACDSTAGAEWVED